MLKALIFTALACSSLLPTHGFSTFSTTPLSLAAGTAKRTFLNAQRPSMEVLKAQFSERPCSHGKMPSSNDKIHPIVDRRQALFSALAIPSIISIVGSRGQAAGAAEGSEEVVMQGEMRLESGADNRFSKAGGKGTAEITIRIVGKGIISQKKFDVDLKDFPKAGR
jgi:hypothetical protein